MPGRRNTRLAGHGLKDGGWPHVYVYGDGDGEEHSLVRRPWLWYEVNQSKTGRGVCKCGGFSDELPTTAARRRWFGEHKAEVRALQEQERSKGKEDA